MSSELASSERGICRRLENTNASVDARVNKLQESIECHNCCFLVIVFVIFIGIFVTFIGIYSVIETFSKKKVEL